MALSAVALSPAKINLGLEITGRRLDGYHELSTILQTISVFDRFVWCETETSFKYESPLSVRQGTDLVNLALQTSHLTAGWHGTLGLEKAVPVSAGLGGGSSDAAFALLLAHPSVEPEELHDLAARLGSDVPFFLTGGTALATGTGTVLRPLPTPDMWCVVVTPDLDIPDKTQTLYDALDPGDFSDGGEVANLADELTHRGQVLVAPPNAFTRALLEYPQIQETSDWLVTAGAPWVSISGAGPSLFTLVGSYHEAVAIHKRVSGTSAKALIGRTLPAGTHLPAARRLSSVLRGEIHAR